MLRGLLGNSSSAAAPAASASNPSTPAATQGKAAPVGAPSATAATQPSTTTTSAPTVTPTPPTPAKIKWADAAKQVSFTTVCHYSLFFQLRCEPNLCYVRWPFLEQYAQNALKLKAERIQRLTKHELERRFIDEGLVVPDIFMHKVDDYEGRQLAVVQTPAGAPAAAIIPAPPGIDKNASVIPYHEIQRYIQEQVKEQLTKLMEQMSTILAQNIQIMVEARVAKMAATLPTVAATPAAAAQPTAATTTKRKRTDHEDDDDQGEEDVGVSDNEGEIKRGSDDDEEEDELEGLDFDDDDEEDQEEEEDDEEDDSRRTPSPPRGRRHVRSASLDVPRKSSAAAALAVAPTPPPSTSGGGRRSSHKLPEMSLKNIIASGPKPISFWESLGWSVVKLNREAAALGYRLATTDTAVQPHTLVHFYPMADLKEQKSTERAFLSEQRKSAVESFAAQQHQQHQQTQQTVSAAIATAMAAAQSQQPQDSLKHPD